MAQLKTYDWGSNVEPSDNFDVYDGPQPPRGVYRVKLRAKAGTTKNGDDKVQIVSEIQDKAYLGCPVFTNLTFGESALWKVKEVRDALGIKKTNGSPAALAKLVDGKICRLNVGHKPYRDDNGVTVTQLDPKRFLPAKSDSQIDEEADNAEPEEELEPEAVDESEAPAEEEEAPAAEEEDAVDLDAMDRRELKVYIKEQGLKVRVTTSMTDDALRDAIVAAQNEEEEEPEGDDGPPF